VLGICRKNRNPPAVIPAKAGIWNFNAARIYRKKPKFKDLDSRLRGNDSVSISDFNPLYFTQTI
ncbi:TPA: hypothetical protein ACKMJT_002218, partial [Neisseria gonorrhoeae]